MCCQDKCTSRARPGIRLGLPISLFLILALYISLAGYYGGENKRKLLVLAQPLAVVFGIVHVIVGYSSWDCSGSIKTVVAFGFIYFIGGLLLIFWAMYQARKAGGRLLDAFVIERFVFVIAKADTSGKVVGYSIAKQEQVAQIQAQIKEKPEVNKTNT